MGIETNFGTYVGKMDILSSLATLSFDKRRSEFFSNELLTLLKLIEERKKKLKELQYSELNLIEGVGPIIKKRLLKKFKNINNIRNASAHELLSVKGVSKKLFARIQQGLK